MEVLDLIYRPFVFTANSLGRQRTTSQFFQLLTPQTLVLVAAAIHCALSEYATGKKVTVMCSQDGYRGKFCPSTVMDCITAKATALINYTWCAASYTPPPIVLFCHNRCFSILAHALQSGLALWYLIQHSILHFCRRSSPKMGTPQSHPWPRSGAPLFYSRLFTSLPFGNAQHRWAALLDSCSLDWICAPQFHSALLHHHHLPPCPPCTPHQALLLSCWHTSFPREFIILPFRLHFDSPRAKLLIPTLQISQIKPNDIGNEFRPLARPESFGNAWNASSFFALLMHCVFLRLLALIGWEI